MSWRNLREEIGEEAAALTGYERLDVAVEEWATWRKAREGDRRQQPKKVRALDLESRRAMMLACGRRSYRKNAEAKKERRRLDRAGAAGVRPLCPACGHQLAIGLRGPPPTYCSRRCAKVIQERRRRARLGLALNAKRRVFYLTVREAQQARARDRRRAARAAQLALLPPCPNCGGPVGTRTGRATLPIYCSKSCQLAKKASRVAELRRRGAAKRRRPNR